MTGIISTRATNIVVIILIVVVQVAIIEVHIVGVVAIVLSRGPVVIS